MQDGELVARLRGGDHAAFEELYLRHRARLYHHALVQTGGRAAIAEEVVHDVFLSLFEGQGTDARDVGCYLLAAVRNRALNALARREGRADRVSLDGVAGILIDPRPEAGSPADAAHRREEARLLAEALLDLPPEQREVVLLRAFEGLAWREVADLTGVPLQTASSRYRAALGRLRDRCRSLSHA